MKSPHLNEQEPGVYVRSRRPDHGIDFLWDRETRKSEEPDRFRLGFFVGGAITGSLLTLAFCFLFLLGGQFFPEKPVIIDEPAVVEEQATDPTTSARPSTEAVEPTPEDRFNWMLFNSSTKKDPAAESTDPEPKASIYAVQEGDTLGSIAIKFYDSSNSKYIEKIQRANKMDSADALSIGQELIIPPAAY